MITWQDHGARLLDAAASCRREAFLVAPFAKRAVLERLVSALDAGVSLTVVTRWRPEEIRAGVSDTDVYGLVIEFGGQLLLQNSLHAKWYRFDDCLLVTSANLTDAAMGWRKSANLEVATDVVVDPMSLAFEAHLRDVSLPASEELVDYMEAAAEALPGVVTGVEFSSEIVREPGSGPWIPATRIPALLFSVYSGSTDDLSAAALAGARDDLSALHVPGGLSEVAFVSFVRARLLTQPIFAEVAAFASRPRRFGEFRDHLAAFAGLSDKHEADRAWQKLMRWMLFFYPGVYWSEARPHSEIFGRRDYRSGNASPAHDGSTDSAI